MSRHIVDLKNKAGQYVFPKTAAEAVATPNISGYDDVEEALSGIIVVNNDQTQRITTLEAKANKFKGYFQSESSLPDLSELTEEQQKGCYAFVKVAGANDYLYIWDYDDQKWVSTGSYQIIGIRSINGKTGETVVLDGTDIEATLDLSSTKSIQAHLQDLKNGIVGIQAVIPEEASSTNQLVDSDTLEEVEDVINETTVHLANAETITGEKTFQAGLQVTSRSDYKWGLFPTAGGAALQIGRTGATEGQYNIYPLGIRPNANNQVLGHLNRFDRINVDKIAATHDGTPAKVQDIIDGTFNTINASDIASTNILTEAQLGLILNGKPTIIKGRFLNIEDAILYRPVDIGSNRYYGTIIGTNIYGRTVIEAYYITSTRSISYQNNASVVDLGSVRSINDKVIPSYPTSPTSPKILTYGTDNTLSWGELPNSAVWGGITGTLADQEDLQDALDLKADVIEIVR